MSIIKDVMDVLNAKTIEPKKRWFGGTYGCAEHRFPIKDGISPREAVMYDLYNAQCSTYATMLANMKFTTKEKK
jgi:hypothetical protein